MKKKLHKTVNTHHFQRIGKMGVWQRRLAYGTLAFCALSGVLWFVWRDLAWLPQSAFERSVLIAHGASGFGVLLLMGSVLPVHVRACWRVRKNVGWGVLSLSLMSVLCLTALGLYYGSEAMHEGFKWTHIGLAVLLLFIFPAHIMLGRRSLYPIKPPEKHSSI